jgi:hypothetical protein
MSQAQEQFPMPALTALGEEFERLAAAPRPVRNRLPLVAPWKLALPAVAAVLALFMFTTAPGQALARHIGELFGLTQEQRILEPICGRATPCIVVNGAAGTGPILVAPGADVLEESQPASACPEALAAYEAVGIHVDAFRGPCPDPADVSKPAAGAGQGALDDESGTSDESRRNRFLHSIGAPTEKP